MPLARENSSSVMAVRTTLPYCAAGDGIPASGGNEYNDRLST